MTIYDILEQKKTIIEIKKFSWFSRIRKLVKKYITNCLSCIFYSPSNTKYQGFLKNIDNKDKPFHTIHLDHFGPIQLRSSKGFKYILVIVDAFTKFFKFYPTKTTNTEKVLKNLMVYMNYYSKPNRTITDRSTCFTSTKFESFCSNNCIQHVKTAAYTPEANGQAERVNRTLTPILAKLINDTNKKWDNLLTKIEYVYNNTYNRPIQNFPCVLLFGLDQNNLNLIEHNLEILVKNNQSPSQDFSLTELREKVKANIDKLQSYNKAMVDRKRKGVQDYKGDLVVLKPNSNHKLSHKFKGPYVIKKN